SHPVLIAVGETAKKLDIPIDPFRDLLIAFRQDQTIHRYATWDDVIGYCRYSANPVGRLVLCLMGYRDEERQTLSDATCTALQLANFWQDVGRDLEKGRIYIPLDIAASHGVSDTAIAQKRFDERYLSLMKDLITRTRSLFDTGAPLANRVSREFRVDVELFTRGGCAVLDAIEAMGYDTLNGRPALDRRVQARLLGRALISRIADSFRSRHDDGQKPESASLAGRHA
ncbi:MAG TPA: squalene/phytoene synthase family protein, partial [Candidatus Acidoferrales bacterium]|nr:squalene/phytoene synthase family protein [Candidatus Acidoferrales bacterium]